MCEFCVQHGEGKKWYLQTKNFAEELLNDVAKQYIINMFGKLEEDTGGRSSSPPQASSTVTDPAAAKAALLQRMEQQKKLHWGQVIPIEDIEKVLDLTISIVRTPCACRSATRGLWDARFCFHFAAVQSDFWPKGVFEQWPDYSRELEVLTKEEAKKELWKLERQGVVHTVWTYGTPFTGSFCNCAPGDCLGFRAMESGVRVFFKGEYIAAIDIEKCNGCRDCMKFCNFGAIQYSPASDRCTINQFQCFGCGLCRVECARDAITLWDRNAIPALAKDW